MWTTTKNKDDADHVRTSLLQIASSMTEYLQRAVA